MTQNPQSGRSDSTNIVRSNRPFVLPIDDPRNNPKFRKAHPQVKFEGHSKPRVAKNKDLHPAQKHRPEIKTKHKQGRLGTHSSHAPAGSVSPAIGNHTDSLIDGNPSDSDGDEDGFSMHEVADEAYTPEQDANEYGHAGLDRLRAIDGVVADTQDHNIAAPTNLSVDSFLFMTEGLDGTGVPTYSATLSFDSEIGYQDYEIRIVKLEDD